jgi:hypothetical protein
MRLSWRCARGARDDLPEVKRLRIGTLETPLRVARRHHPFVASKADWFDNCDGLPQLRRFPD